VQRLRLVERCRERDIWLRRRWSDWVTRLVERRVRPCPYRAHGAPGGCRGRRPRPGAARGVRNALGILAKDRGDHAGAANRAEAALKLLQTLYELTAPELASLHHNLADLANAQHQFGEAEVHARRALKCRRNDPGLEVSTLAGDLSVLGAVC